MGLFELIFNVFRLSAGFVALGPYPDDAKHHNHSDDSQQKKVEGSKK